MEAGRRRTRVIAIALLAMALAAGGAIAWFQPQKLLIDQRVDEALPGAPAAGPATTGGDAPTATRTAGAEPVTVAAGRFRSVVIWCRRFTYAFGAAELAPAR